MAHPNSGRLGGFREQALAASRALVEHREHGTTFSSGGVPVEIASNAPLTLAMILSLSPITVPSARRSEGGRALPLVGTGGIGSFELLDNRRREWTDNGSGPG